MENKKIELEIKERQHERINEKIETIKGYLEAIQKETQPNKQTICLSYIKEKTDRIKRQLESIEFSSDIINKTNNGEAF